MKRYRLPMIMLAVIELVAVTLWLTKKNLFYLLNFSYIGLSITLGVFLFIRKYRCADTHKMARRSTDVIIPVRSSELWI